MKKATSCLLLALCIGSTGCGVLEKGQRVTASIGFEGYSDHEERIAVTPDADPIICKAWRFAFCKGAQVQPDK